MKKMVEVLKEGGLRLEVPEHHGDIARLVLRKAHSGTTPRALEYALETQMPELTNVPLLGGFVKYSLLPELARREAIKAGEKAAKEERRLAKEEKKRRREGGGGAGACDGLQLSRRPLVSSRLTFSPPHTHSTLALHAPGHTSITVTLAAAPPEEGGGAPKRPRS